MNATKRACYFCDETHEPIATKFSRSGVIVDKDLWFYDYCVPSMIRIYIKGDDGREYFGAKSDEKVLTFLHNFLGRPPSDCLGKESDIIGKRVEFKPKLENKYDDGSYRAECIKLV